MSDAAARKYRVSEKRNVTRQANRAAIEAAAWNVFCSMGLDAANIRDIVNASGVSPGTFYNYFGTKEAVFEVVSQRVLERIRAESRAARAKAGNAEEFFSACYESYLNVLHSTEGAFEFIHRNQHHIRAQLHSSSAVSGLAADLAEDLGRFVATGAMSRRERLLVASIIIAAGAEAVFQLGRRPRARMKFSREFLARYMMHGLSGWGAV